MPELPEVETIRRGLEKKIVGKTIRKVEILNPKSALFKPQEVEGKKVLNIWRRAKLLGIDLGCNVRSSARLPARQAIRHQSSGSSSNDLKTDRSDNTVGPIPKSEDLTLLIHLKMSGQLVLDQRENKLVGGHPTEDMFGTMPNGSTRVIFEFNDESHLYFNDQRKFGWIKLVSTRGGPAFGRRSLELGVHSKDNLLGNLGPEPLEKNFTWEALKENLSKHPKTPIKVALMDQSVVAGVGNIYANEALFLAQVDPKRLVKTLTDDEFKKIKQAVVDSLEVALKHGGSTRINFVDSEGKKGRFLDYANVYERAGKPCKTRLPAGQVCSGIVKKITVGGRGTYFCESCQK